jgi:hypothetical protein
MGGQDLRGGGFSGRLIVGLRSALLCFDIVTGLSGCDPRLGMAWFG